MISLSPPVLLDQSPDRRGLVETAAPQRPFRQDIVNHLPEILADPGTERRAERTLGTPDDAARQPARGDPTQEDLLRQSLDPEPVAEPEGELDDPMVDQRRAGLDTRGHRRLVR